MSVLTKRKLLYTHRWMIQGLLLCSEHLQLALVVFAADVCQLLDLPRCFATQCPCNIINTICRIYGLCKPVQHMHQLMCEWCQIRSCPSDLQVSNIVISMPELAGYAAKTGQSICSWLLCSIQELAHVAVMQRIETLSCCVWVWCNAAGLQQKLKLRSYL